MNPEDSILIRSSADSSVHLYKLMSCSIQYVRSSQMLHDVKPRTEYTSRRKPEPPKDASGLANNRKELLQNLHEKKRAAEERRTAKFLTVIQNVCVFDCKPQNVCKPH